MGKLSFGKVLDCLCLSPGTNSCFCTNSLEFDEDEFEQEPLVASDEKSGQVLKLKDVPEKQTLAFQLKPKIVVLRVSMHCNGCARKVEKHVSRLDGVTSYKVDLENKMVVVIGDILPFEVLESVSKKINFVQATACSKKEEELVNNYNTRLKFPSDVILCRGRNESAILL